MTGLWIRSQRASVAETDDQVLLIGRDGSVRRLDGDSAELARVVLAYFATARSEAELIAHVESLAGPLGERGRVVSELVALLCEAGALEAADRHVRGPSGCNVVVAISGAVAASHAPALVTALQRRGHVVEVALTATAARFVAVETLAALVQREPQQSMWPRAAHVPVPHVALARWAELVVVYPASATTIGRIANGDFSDLVSAVALTTRAPVVIVPSMNVDMLESPAVQRNLDQLRSDGFWLVHGVPSQEVADAPTARETLGGAAPAPAEVVATIDALRHAGVLRGRRPAATTGDARWNAAYRTGLVPWASDACDGDIAAMLVEHAPPPRQLLDVGCGLGQIARHAADAGYRVIATDIAESALAAAHEAAGSRDSSTPREASRSRDITWLRDDICASGLVGPFDVIVDRATLHTLSPARARTWAAAIRRLIARGGIAIIKCHRDGVAGATTGWSAAAIAKLMPDFELVVERPAELPGLVDAAPVPSVLVVMKRAR